MDQIYVLECSNDKYYIGKTKDVIKRFEEHKLGKGSVWTSKFKPLKIVECRTVTSEYDEDNTTKTYMKKYGIEHVRGGSYAQITLPNDVMSVLQREFGGTMDLCYKCNLAGHFSTKCPNIIGSNPLAGAAPVPLYGFVTPSNLNILYTNCKSSTKHIVSSKEEEWECEYCDRSFTTKYGRMIHERSCKKVTNESVSDKKSGSCFRCGRKGHYSPDCYATSHVKGYSI